MHAASLLFSAVVLAVSLVAAAELKIEIIKAVECERKTKSGDEISVEYTGTFTNGTVFDTNVGGDPFTFTVGIGEVIDGFDAGHLKMCIGEKRKLTVPPELGYGNHTVGPIPPNSTLIFATELLAIKGVEAPKGA